MGCCISRYKGEGIINLPGTKYALHRIDIITPEIINYIQRHSNQYQDIKIEEKVVSRKASVQSGKSYHLVDK